MAMNPPHVLIARNSRAGNSAALSSPIETHAAAAGIFRSSGAGSPPWTLEELAPEDVEGLEGDDDDSTDQDGDGVIDVEETFRENSRFPGTVKIVVEGTTFWAHKQVLYFASPFFEAILSGQWAETSGRPLSTSSVITISQPPARPGEPGASSSDNVPTMTFSPVPEESDLDIIPSGDEHETGSGDTSLDEDRAKAIAGSLSKLEGPSNSSFILDSKTPMTGAPATYAGASDESGGDSSSASVSPIKERKPSLEVPSGALNGRKKRKRKNGPEAVIILKEERAQTFQDFLKHVYPNLVCTITWANVEGLMNIAHKLSVPALQTQCLDFLLTHAAGRPIKAMRIAELFDEEELYREASRFVLDNPGGWTEEEMGILSRDTQLKLEKRRTWFLERVLKLGLVQVAKEYQCCSTCPDSSTCARQLEEKWRQAYHAVFRFGPCQPSMVYRYLRTLEGVNPPLSLTQLSCQTTAKAFVSTLFDRMFSLGVRGSGTDTAPPAGVTSRMAAAAAAAAGPRRHFLYCLMKDPPKDRKERTLLRNGQMIAVGGSST